MVRFDNSITLVTSILLLGCGGPRTVTVGSKNFTEQVLLGEIAAQQIENKLHVPVRRSLNLGGTLLAHQALVIGAIDVYPEYTGTALTSILKQTAGKDAHAVWENVAKAYREKFHVEWLPPLGFNNSFAMIIKSEGSGNDRIRTLSDAARRAAPWKLAVGYEFVKRPDGLAGLIAAYGLRIDGSPQEMDLGLLYPALQQSKVEMAAASRTDGLIDAMHLRILEDDRSYFPPYEAAFLTRRPELRDALSELSGKFNDAIMRRLNYEVDGKHRPVADVAREFLANRKP